jgi:hypothetical protein
LKASERDQSRKTGKAGKAGEEKETKAEKKVTDEEGGK